MSAHSWSPHLSEESILHLNRWKKVRKTIDDINSDTEVLGCILGEYALDYDFWIRLETIVDKLAAEKIARKL
jgi:hypothetical protein